MCQAFSQLGTSSVQPSCELQLEHVVSFFSLLLDKHWFSNRIFARFELDDLRL
jgi:hypothetical protein